MNSEHLDKEYAILENIYTTHDKVRQRDLAHIAGISLGMTNAIMKRLIKKGFLIAQKINHRNINYAVTPTGINEIMRRSYRYFKRTIKNIVYYKDKIQKLIEYIQSKGYTRIVLAGKSDLEFIFDHCCHNAHLEITHAANGLGPTVDSQSFYVMAENIPQTKNHPAVECVYLHTFLMT